MLPDYFFARIYDPIVDPYLRKVRHKVLELARGFNSKSVLDVCCGTGNQLKLLKKNGFEVTGVDLSDQMLRVSDKGKYTVNCRKEDATALSFAEQSFDLVMVTLALHENPRDTASAILEEMFRVVREEGHVLVIDYSFGSNTYGWARVLTTAVERLAGGEHFANFRKYTAYGGLPVLLANIPHKQVSEYLFAGNSLVIKVLKKPSPPKS